MRIFVNGKVEDFEKNGTIEDILRELKYENKYFAVSLNMQCVPKHLYHSTWPKEDDAIEIIVPMQGG